MSFITHILAQKEDRQLNTKVCSSESTIFIILSLDGWGGRGWRGRVRRVEGEGEEGGGGG